MGLDTQSFVAGIIGSLAVFALAIVVLLLYERRRGFRLNRLRANLMLCLAVLSLTHWALADFATHGLLQKLPFVIAFSTVASIFWRLEDRLDRRDIDPEAPPVRRG